MSPAFLPINGSHHNCQRMDLSFGLRHEINHVDLRLSYPLLFHSCNKLFYTCTCGFLQFPTFDRSGNLLYILCMKYYSSFVIALFITPISDFGKIHQHQNILKCVLTACGPKCG